MTDELDMEHLNDLPAPIRALLVPFSPLIEMISMWEGMSATGRWGITCTMALLVWFFMQANLKPGRTAMRWLLCNRGWLYRDSGQSGGPKTSSNIQLRQRVYLMSLWLLWKTIGWEKRLLSGKWRTQKTYAVQDTLPPLPVPKLRDTFRRLLDSVRPIWPHDEYEQMVNLVKELGVSRGSGEQLQRLLVRRARSNPQTAWIEEWWEKEYLLSSRLPLPGFCNWYGLDRPDTPCMSQSLRAAWLILGAIRFHRHLAREKLEPLRMMSLVPLCMRQYQRVFSTCRIPCVGRDELHTYECPSPFGPSNIPQMPELPQHLSACLRSGRDSPSVTAGRGGGAQCRLKVVAAAERSGRQAVWGGGSRSGDRMQSAAAAAPYLAVMSRGQVYTMQLFHSDGISLSVSEIQAQVEVILQMSREAESSGTAEAPIGMLTTEHRDTWATLRLKLILAHPDNEAALQAVERSMFLLVLEGACPPAIEEQAKTMFLGDGRNRWFDKSFQLIVFENACAGVNVESSWADAPVASHLFGFMHDHENMAHLYNNNLKKENNYKKKENTYNDAASSCASSSAPPHHSTSSSSASPTIASSRPRLPPPQRLSWRLTSELAEAIDRAQRRFEALAERTDRRRFEVLAERTDLHVMHMRYFGKGFIKKCQMSPDAFVQMALQLAYYRTTGSIDLMGESAHTRQFLHGRTEIVRAVSSDSVAFIKAMAHLDTGAAETKLHLLRRACVTHVERVMEAMNGQGVDNHLFGLLMMAKSLGDSHAQAALEKGLDHSGFMMLSSHAPAQRGPSGGFGTPQEGGYAVSYLINEDNIYFHVCYRKKEEKSAEKSGEEKEKEKEKRGASSVGARELSLAIEKALLEMSVLCTKKAQTAASNSVSSLDWSNL